VTLILESGRFVPGDGWSPQPRDPYFSFDGRSVDNAAIGGPDELSPGTYTVGIGVSEYNDVPTADTVGFTNSRVLCTRTFSVDEATRQIDVHAAFDARCRITIAADGVTIPDDCATADVTALLDGGQDRIDTSVDSAHELLDISIVALDVDDYVTQLTVRYTDAACLSHPLIGPIINSVLRDRLPPGTPRPRTDVFGRFLATAPEIGCSILLDPEGNTWDVDWPDGYTLIASTPPRLVAADGSEVARQGDLIGVRGSEAAHELRGCLAHTRFRVDQIAFVERATP
jgi:hypothetical protein